MDNENVSQQENWFSYCFSWKGRRKRLAYSGFSIIIGIFSSVMAGLFNYLGNFANSSNCVMYLVVLIISLFSIIATLAASLANTARRLHDIGMDGKFVWLWQLLFLFPLFYLFSGFAVLLLIDPVIIIICPIIGFVLGLVLLFFPGDKQANRFGPRP